MVPYLKKYSVLRPFGVTEPFSVASMLPTPEAGSVVAVGGPAVL